MITLTADPRRTGRPHASGQMLAGKRARDYPTARPGGGGNTLVALRAPSVLPPPPQNKPPTNSTRTEVTDTQRSEPRTGRTAD
jgi:hypothetical protein